MVWKLATIICATGWGFTWFLLLTIARYVKSSEKNPSREELRDCAEAVLRHFFKIEK